MPAKALVSAIALQLAADGFTVGVHYHRDAAGAQETLDAIVQAGGTGRLLAFDVGNREQCRAVLEQEMADHGAWYGVVSNAGITRDGAFPALSDDDWDSVIHTNLDSFYNVIHPCIMPMIGTRKGGRIITLSSVSGIMGNRGQVNYSAAKAGIIGATKALATEPGKTQNHRQLHRAGADRYRHDRDGRSRAARGDVDDPDAAYGPGRGGRRAGELPDVG